MKEGSWYNGYTPSERLGKLRVMNRLLARGELPAATGPCALCGDPASKVEYHDEDYGQPYLWGQPAQFCLCRRCHRHTLHTRFARPSAWHAHVAHVRRGGYASDFTDPKVKKEVQKYRDALDLGEIAVLESLRPYDRVVGSEWFATLRMDSESLKDPTARQRLRDGVV